MIVTNIEYSTKFARELKKMPKKILHIALDKERLFRLSPLHLSLRLHQLRGKFSGLWSISLTRSYRIIFKRMPSGDILFVSIGKHDVYKYL